MVNAKINGIEIQVEKGTTVLDACQRKRHSHPYALLFKRDQ